DRCALGPRCRVGRRLDWPMARARLPRSGRRGGNLHSARRLDGDQPMNPLKTIRAGVLDVAYYECGPAGGTPGVLLHGFPYDIHAYADVAGRLAHAGLRVVVPYLRGYGATRFADPATPRSGQQAALGADLRELIDALGLDRPILAGYDWGGRAACVVAALWPQRCGGLVTANPGYSIQDIASAG